jgi:hypothetical protein
VTFAADQPQYLPLPAHRNAAGEVTSCWSLTWRERFRVLFSGQFFITVLTFNKPLQPILPRVQWPDPERSEAWQPRPKPEPHPMAERR